MKTLCLGCMEEYEGEGRYCPNCGYDQTLPPEESHYLTPGVTIGGRYRIGRTLGSGGFGITYIAYDLTLQKKMAIKEYLPMEFATRLPGQTKVSVYQGEKQEQFAAGMRKTLEEASLLAEFRQTPGITRIYDFFEANNTAYIVMELLEGESLKDHLERVEKMSTQEALPIILAVTRALKEVHAKNIIHRDIAPDNIYLLNNGEVKLLDFGASRQVTTTNSKSLTVILKAGYAPVEQYQSGSQQGPWTDIYALAATFYKMITGKKPPDSWDRRKHDTLEAPSSLGIDIEESLENALMNALQVQAKDRTKSAEQFEADLLSSHVEPIHVVEQDPNLEQLHWPLWMKVLFGTAGVAILAGIIVLASGIIRTDTDRPAGFGNEELMDGYVRVPNLLNLSQEAAKARTEQSGLNFRIAGTMPSDTILKGYVMSQQDENGNELTRGDPIEEGSLIQVIVSSGNGMTQIPDVLYMQEDAAIAELESLDLTAVNVETAEGIWAPAGTVTGISPSVGEEISQDEIITLTVSSGAVDTGSGSTDIPDIIGLNEDSAWEQLKASGLFMIKDKIEYQVGTQAGEILSQEPPAGGTGAVGDIVTVVVSAGPRQIQLPDLIGLTEEDAVAQLESLGLITGDSIRQYDQTAASGTVTAQSLEPGIVNEGEIVTLTISRGPAPVETTRSAPANTDSVRPAESAAPPATQPQTAPPETTSVETTPAPTTTQAPPETTGNAKDALVRWSTAAE